MTLSEYIAEMLSTNETFPFPTVTAVYSKKSVLTSIGQVERNIYFLKEGIIEIGMETEIGNKIIDFCFSNDLVSSYTSFLAQETSDVYLYCLTDCIVEIVPYAQLKEAYKTSLLANQFGRLATEGLYMKRVRKEKDALTKNAEQRYLELIKYRPEVIKEIPVHRIARYLGIHPESLSRLRKSIS
ncbi:Crp/Fnr family transcriptional regulator [Pedobacter cryoconitis]|uniref:CRP-like cAMP-binding protein n=1 Tax=Pedobacter cryoconitis TaxID=188932 RepID=A0A327SNT9_9SPHI|nr:Crp/Fnr family transcriptional regulator [Pedobacter cryoconitis]RAJ29223.1 CRP-like cAMP-binding protein [Pedobacter cryoconitis]